MVNHNFWVRKNGKKVKIDDMNEYHLRNALRKTLKEKRQLELKLKQKDKHKNIILSFIRDLQKEFINGNRS
jgi:hypothetical protein